MMDRPGVYESETCTCRGAVRRCNDVHSRKGAKREDRRAAAGVLYSARVLVCAAAILLVSGGALKPFCKQSRS